ncbi:peptide deformylase [Streptomyces sp. HSG2]|uniref:peptide deformylase n=1 Tax=Streptomyces sp. HSG2 TaxID=2797167 RepID=UPI0019075F6D|nr:peptide deformylase [Streptomyces sp. HSG2]
MRYGSIPGAHGRVRPLTLLGDPVLREPSRDVTDFGPGLGRLVEDLFATMYAAGGVGLAACQVGVPLRVFVYDCPDDEDVRHLGHLVNPRTVATDGVVVRGPEGCLSLPGLEGATERHDRAVVEGLTLAGEAVTVRGTGFFARCLQHECDHLDGRVYADRLAGWRARRLERRIAKAPWGRGRTRDRGGPARGE